MKRVSIKSLLTLHLFFLLGVAPLFGNKPFVQLEAIQLGNYHSIKDYPKAKGVNLKIKVPKGWKVEEGDRPNVVVKFINGSDVFLVTVEDYMTFVSKKNARALFEDEEFVNNLSQGFSNVFQQWELLEKKRMTIDNYPALELVVAGKGERIGIQYEVVMKTWYIFVEDKIIYLQGSTPKSENRSAKSQLFNLLTNSVVLPDQYN
jgi:hypothetical protein